MRVENTEKVLERLREELEWARGKAAKWQARVTELEEQVQEKENLLILRAVRSVAPSPEQLRGLLDQIKGVHGPSIVLGAAGPAPDTGQELSPAPNTEAGPPDMPDEGQEQRGSPDSETDHSGEQETGPYLPDAPETGQIQTDTAETAPEDVKEEQRDED